MMRVPFLLSSDPPPRWIYRVVIIGIDLNPLGGFFEVIFP